MVMCEMLRTKPTLSGTSERALVRLVCPGGKGAWGVYYRVRYCIYH